MVQAVWFDAGAERAGRLLLVIHHLAVDGVSWRILVPDLAAAWRAARRAAGRAAAAGHVVPALGGAACRAGQDAAVVPELPFWRGMLREPSLRLCGRAARSGSATCTALRASALTLPAAVTEPLLTRVPAAFHGGIKDVLLTGLALAVADWSGGGRAQPSASDGSTRC